MANMRSPTFDAEEYWSDLVSGSLTLDKVGNVGCGVAFNRWIYRHKWEALASILADRSIVPSEASIFEAAFGVGFYLEWWDRLGARSVGGVDVSEAAVVAACRKFPNFDLQHGDLSKLGDPTTTYDVVLALDVLYHLVDDGGWAAALTNLARRTTANGVLIFTDQFWPRSETRTQHVRRRTFDEYQSILSDYSMRIVDRRKFTRWLGHDRPANTRGLAAFLLWLASYRTVRVASRIGLGEPVGSMAGRLLYGLERSDPAPAPTVPCLEIVVAIRQ